MTKSKCEHRYEDASDDKTCQNCTIAKLQQELETLKQWQREALPFLICAQHQLHEQKKTNTAASGVVYINTELDKLETLIKQAEENE